jgi:hypothetical protein
MTCLPLPRRLLTHTSNHCRLRRSQLEVGIIGPTKEEGGDQPRIPRSVTKSQSSDGRATFRRRNG